MAEHALSARTCSTSTLLEPLQLDDEDLGHRVELELLSDISVLPAQVAVPLVVPGQHLLLRVAREAGAKIETLLSSRIAVLVVVGLKSAV